MAQIAQLPKPPYYAVIFTSIRSQNDEGYAEMDARMEELAKQQPGYLGIEAASAAIGITISYWTDLDSIRAWRANLEHAQAQRLGREKWYSAYSLRVAKVEYTRDFPQT